jgi:hypothetical protein
MAVLQCSTAVEGVMGERTGLASFNPGKTGETAVRLVAEGRYGNVSEACGKGCGGLNVTLIATGV